LATETALPAAAISPLPIQTGTYPLHSGATSALAVDAATATVLFSQNASAKRPIASLTKLATALVILDRHQPTELVKVPPLPIYATGDQLAGLQPGETYSVGDLTKAMLINSSDDAADTLAIWDSGSDAKFATRMNTKMSDWGITGAHFSNPSGLQDDNNFATATALVKIAQLALIDPFIRQAVAQQQVAITNTSGRTLTLPTTNDLLASGQFYGIKTGYTPVAGECFVGLARINGHEVITVVLDAGDRFAATTTITNWIGQNWQWL
jgi:D-alanyl-D-alanine carboxypeptidase (penicillin-binding protein 5/6)